MRFLFFFWCCITLVTCRQPDPQPAGAGAALLGAGGLWRLPVDPALRPFVSMYPVFYENLVIVSVQKKGSISQLIGIRIQDGRRMWTFEHPALGDLYYNAAPYLSNGILVLPCRQSLLALQAETGRLVWFDQRTEIGADYLQGTGNTVFRAYSDSTNQKTAIFAININDGQFKLLAAQSHVGYKCLPRTPVPFSGQNGEVLLFCAETHWVPATAKTNTLGRVLTLEGQLTGAVQTLADENFRGHTLTKQPYWDSDHQTFYLVIDTTVVAWSVEKGLAKWRTRLPGDMLTSWLSVGETNLFFPAENGHLYCLDKKSGAINWTTTIAGTPGRLSLGKATIALVGGSDGLCHVVDRANGAKNRTLETPNRVNYPHLHWQRSFGIHPTLGIGILCDGKDFFAYQFPP